MRCFLFSVDLPSICRRALDFPSEHERKYTFYDLPSICRRAFDLDTTAWTANRRKTPAGMPYLFSKKVKTNRRKIIFGIFFRNLLPSKRILNGYFHYRKNCSRSVRSSLKDTPTENISRRNRRKITGLRFSVGFDGKYFPSEIR